MAKQFDDALIILGEKLRRLQPVCLSVVCTDGEKPLLRGLGKAGIPTPRVKRDTNLMLLVVPCKMVLFRQDSFRGLSSISQDSRVQSQCLTNRIASRMSKLN